MEEIILIKGDSSDIYEFISKDLPTLDDSWEASWAITKKMGQNPELTGNLGKNTEILNADGSIKYAGNNFFILQLTPQESASLEVGKYYLGVEIRQLDLLNQEPIFRREVMQVKLIIKEEIVLI